MGITMGGLSSIETLKATGRESDFFEMWCGYETKLINSMQKIGLVITTMNVVPTLLATLATTLVLSIGSLRIMNGELTIGMFIAFQMLMGYFLTQISSLVELGTTMQDSEGQLNRIEDVHKYPEDQIINSYDCNLSIQKTKLKLSGYVELKEICFVGIYLLK